MLVAVALGFVGWASPILIWWLNAHGVAAGPGIPYGNDAHCDVWYYFGLATLAESAWTLAPASRYVARVTVYLPTYALENILPFGPAERSFVLYHTLTYLGVILAVRPFYEVGTAVLCAVLVTTSALYISVFSTTYPSIAAVAYGMLALACLTQAATASNRSKLSLCLAAGIFLAWAAVAHVMVAIFLAFLPAVLVVRDSWYSRALLVDLIPILVGGLLGLALVGAASLSIGQPTVAFWYQISAAIVGIGDWYNADLVKQSVAIPLLLGFSAALAVAIRHGNRRSTIVAAITWATTIGAAAETFLLGGTSLVYDQFFVLLLVPGTLAIAELVDRPNAAPIRPVVIVLCIAVYLALMSLLALRVGLRAFYLQHAMLLTCLFMVGVVAATIWRRRCLTVVMLFLALQAAVANYSRAHWVFDPVLERDRAGTVARIVSFYSEYGIATRPAVRISTDANIDLALGAFRSLVRCRLDETVFHPSDVKVGRKPLRPGELLIVLSSPAENLAAISEMLKVQSLKLENARSEVFGSPLRQLRVTIGSLSEQK